MQELQHISFIYEISHPILCLFLYFLNKYIKNESQFIEDFSEIIPKFDKVFWDINLSLNKQVFFEASMLSTHWFWIQILIYNYKYIIF